MIDIDGRNGLELLNYIWDRQREFNTKLVDYSKLDLRGQELWTKEYILHLESELFEVLREINWKVHRPSTERVVIRSNLLEELTDVFKYLLSILILWGFTPEEFLQSFEDKSQVVEQRFIQEFKSQMSRIAVVDIDGVLAAYPEGFIDFVRQTHPEVPPECPTTLDLRYYLMQYGVGPREYVGLKDQYRSSGYKRSLQVCRGAHQVLDYLKDSGYTVLLMTARPYRIYKRLYSDTLNWLRSNNLKFDGIVWDDDKSTRAISDYGDKIKLFLEDNPSEANRIAQVGYTVYLINRPYNQSVSLHENVIRLGSLDELPQVLEGLRSKVG